MRANPVSAETLSRLVGGIYDCVLDPSRWPGALSAIRHELNCHNAVLTLQAMPRGEALLSISDGIDPQWVARVPEYSADVVEMWGGLERISSAPLLEPLALSRFSTRDFTTNRYFVEWGRPQGLIDILAIALTRDGSSLGSIAFGRHESSGLVGDRELEWSRLLTPHLYRAVVITRLLEARIETASMFEATFDTIVTPIVLVGKDLTVVHANQAAEALFRRHIPVSIENRCFVASSRAAMAALWAAINGICRDEGAIGAKGIGIPATVAHDEPCVLHVLPLKHRRLHSASSAVAAIFVASRTTPPHPPAQLVRALFELTAAESKVFELVVAGFTVTQIAARLGIQTSTVRTHLLHIFGKTGTHRQSDLAILAASLATPALTE